MEYWSQVREIEASKLIFIDESGVNLALLRLYARALIGRRARGRKPQKRGRNISIISAISLEKVVASVNIYGAVDAVTFEGFILKEVLPKIKEGATSQKPLRGKMKATTASLASQPIACGC